MGKTGGGKGSNQHRIRGISRDRQTRGREVNLSLNLPSNGDNDWDALLTDYPTYPGDYKAVPEPQWDDLSGEVARFKPKGVERAVNRYVLRESASVYNDARLEGFAFTEPEIVTLMNGGHVAGHTEGEQAQVAGLKKASDYMLNQIKDSDEIEPNQSLSDDLHIFIGAPLGLKSIAFRGNQKEQYEGPKVRLGRGEIFRALDARITAPVMAAGLNRISQLDHPILRATTWAAFATYEQFYLDGNKRTGRYVMNTVLMSHGYDAILLPESLKAQYEDALVEAYRTGDLTPHIRFLIDRYRDN